MTIILGIIQMIFYVTELVVSWITITYFVASLVIDLC